MSGFWSDLFSGNLSGAWDDAVAAFKKLPTPVQAFVVRLEGDEGQLLQQLAAGAIMTVVGGGFSTSSFVAAGKSIVAQGAAQGKTIFMQDAMAQLNILAAPLNPPQPAVSPAATAPAAGS